MSELPDIDVHETGPGEVAEINPSIWASRLDAEVQMARDMGVEAHTTIVDTAQQEHKIELTGDIEQIESSGRHTRIWLRNAGIITVTGAAVVTALAILRHRTRKT